MDLGPRPWLQHVAAAIGCLPSCPILSLAVSWRFSLANGGTCDAPSLFFEVFPKPVMIEMAFGAFWVTYFLLHGFVRK